MGYTVRKKIYPLNDKPYLTNEKFGPFETKDQAKAEIKRLKESLPGWDCSTGFFIEQKTNPGLGLLEGSGSHQENWQTRIVVNRKKEINHGREKTGNYF